MDRFLTKNSHKPSSAITNVKQSTIIPVHAMKGYKEVEV